MTSSSSGSLTTCNLGVGGAVVSHPQAKWGRICFLHAQLMLAAFGPLSWGPLQCDSHNMAACFLKVSQGSQTWERIRLDLEVLWKCYSLGSTPRAAESEGLGGAQEDSFLMSSHVMLGPILAELLNYRNPVLEEVFYFFIAFYLLMDHS